MLGFFIGVYITGGLWYYSRSIPLTRCEIIMVALTWPGLLAMEMVFRGLDFAARKALRDMPPIEKKEEW